MSTRAREPQVRVRSAGRISDALENLAAMYKAQNPSMDCRWVYDPVSKPELSGVTGRQAEGYRVVLPSELGDQSFIQLEMDKPVRVADTVLMGISASLKRELEIERADAAAQAVARIDRSFYAAIEEMQIPGAEERHRPKPIGRSIIEERTIDYDIEQRGGDG